METHLNLLQPASNLPKGFQRLIFLRNFCAGVFLHIYVVQGLGLLRVKSLLGMNPNPVFGLIVDSNIRRSV